MSEIVGDYRVYLDHLISRQSIRYSPSIEEGEPNDRKAQAGRDFLVGKEDKGVRYSDILNDNWFRHLRKPDFQRETNAWTPRDCADFLETIVKSRIVPSIILWDSKDNVLLYVLDGAHRLSVIRAWMTDDWGDKAGNYYVRRDVEHIKKVAGYTRELVRREIGAFKDYEKSHQEFNDIATRGEAPKQVMGAQRFTKAIFYAGALVKHNTLAIQWEHGDYESAEQSFLRINRKGQALDPWEATLIEYRHSSYARCIMCIANGGESGHYWPTLPESESIGEDLAATIKEFSARAYNIYRYLFVPPFKLPIDTLNVPMMVAPAYFQKHKYLLEIVPLIADGKIAATEEHQVEIMKQDATASVENIVKNASQILTSMERGLEHLISQTHSSTSLAIVPLFYWYNQKAQYVRGLFYGFVYWLLSGTEKDVTNRKLIFSANRVAFEYWLFNLKVEISTLQERGGAGLKGTPKIAAFFQGFLDTLHANPQLSIGSQELKEKVIQTLLKYTHITARGKQAKAGRLYSTKDKTQINIREMFENSIKCHICGGVVNLQYGGVQYDHVLDFADTKTTDPKTGKPTHPFCNRHKKQIQLLREGKESLSLPDFSPILENAVPPVAQLDFWGVIDFPQ
jgi:hypothetical protein